MRVRLQHCVFHFRFMAALGREAGQYPGVDHVDMADIDDFIEHDDLVGAGRRGAVIGNNDEIRLVFQVARKVRGKLKKTSVPARFDLVMVGNGRATGMLFVVAFNARPVTDAYKLSLADTLAHRLAIDPAATPPAP